MKFNTQWNTKTEEWKNTNEGNRYEPVFELEEETQKLIEVSTNDTQEEINSHLESADLKIIIDRIMNGEEDLINKNEGEYTDISEAKHKNLLTIEENEEKIKEIKKKILKRLTEEEKENEEKKEEEEKEKDA